MSSYWFIPLIIESILLLICIAYESGWLATLSVVVAGLVIHFAGFFDLLGFVNNNIGNILLGALGYVVAGTAWSLVKWTLFVLKRRDEYRVSKSKFLKEYVGPGDALQAWKNKRQYHDEAPKVSYYKSKISLWFFYWPFSMINTVIHDFTKKVFNLVYNTVKGSFQNISDRIFSDLDKE